METVKISGLVSGLGDLAMAGWTAMVPGQGTRSYSLLAHCGTQQTGTVMPSVAAALGLDPIPGSVTSRLRQNTRFRLSEGGWATLCMPCGERIEYRAFDAWQAACRREKYACLYVSYRRFPSGVSVEQHLKYIVQSDQYALGLIPVS
ncbi:hypothetical protein [Streptomyces sp. NPDC126514]|uniref:hypothetical protein n=1 Tax=Streptomyces sp. NPDC126514 TaxID=3155210 RepID=UPI003320AEDC